MLDASLHRILHDVGDDAVVLDVGGWARPLPRADWVIDLMPYDSRGRYGQEAGGPERFSSATWIQRDVCDREPLPFADDSVDFVVCSQTLEDLRDPIWVCAEMVRVGRAGYIEVPSRLEEQSLGVHGPWAGWSHHRWLVDVADDSIEFVFKPHLLHARPTDHFPVGFHAGLTPEERVATLWWTGSFRFAERVFVEADELDRYLAEPVTRRRPPPRSGRSPLRSGRPPLRSGRPGGRRRGWLGRRR